MHRLVWIPLLMVIGCSASNEESANSPTYFEDVKPILDAHCVSCHREGEFAPFQLESYEDASALAGVVADATANRTMPPFLADPDCADYVGAPTITDEEIDTLRRWNEGGAPSGDPAEVVLVDVPAPEGLSRVDLELRMAEAYQPVGQPDDYRCFLMDWPFEERKYVTGFDVRVDNVETVHHVIAFKVDPDEIQSYRQMDAQDGAPGWECFGGPGGNQLGFSWVGSWAPGADGGDFPEGTGIEILPGHGIVLQVHYSSVGPDSGWDQSAILYKLADEVEQEGYQLPFTNPRWPFVGGMDIPAGEPSVTHSFSYAMDGPLLVYSAGLHMHLLGKRAKFYIERKDGGTECMVDIPRWDFNWQGGYSQEEPWRLEKGDRMVVECEWDNSPENQPILDGEISDPVDVDWGDGTRDEMCLATFYSTTSWGF